MRRCFTFPLATILSAWMVVGFFHSALAQAGVVDPVTTVVDRSQATGSMPAIIDNAGNNRGGAFNGTHVFVASRQNGNHVYYWPVDDPEAPVQELDLTGVTGGTFVVSDVAVSGTHTLMCNMVFVNGTFKVYHWNGLTGAPAVLLEYPNAPARLGDAITVIGNPATSARLIVSGHGSKNFYAWTIENGTIANTTPEVLTYNHVASTNFGRITKVPGENYYLAAGPTMGMILLDSVFQLVDTINNAFFPSWAMHAQVFNYRNQRLLGYVHVKSAPAENALYVADISEGTGIVAAFASLAADTFANRLVHNVSLGNIANGNASAGFDVVTDALGNVRVMAYAAGNGYLVQQFGDSELASVDPVSTLFDVTQAAAAVPAIINDAGTNRGAAYNGSHVFVASRQNGNHVYYWDANDTAAAPAELNITGVSGGTFALSDVAVSGNHVVACNMVFVNGTFKVYHWNALDATPAVLLEYPSAPARLGDAITLIGNPATAAKLIASGHGSKSFYVWTIENGVVTNAATPTVYTYDAVTNVNFARITPVPGNENLYLATGPIFGAMLLDSDFAVVASVPANRFPSWPMHARVFEYNGQRLLGYVHIKSNPAENAFYVVDINEAASTVEAFEQFAQPSFAARLAHSANLGNVSNGNASAAFDVVTDILGNVRVMAYSAGNGFIIQQFGDAVQASLDPVTTILDKSQAGGNASALISEAGNNRGAAFNGRHVFVASRQNGNHVYYWDVNNTAADPQELSIAGISGGTFALSDLAVSGDHIFLSNMVFANGTFKVYHWNGVSAQPTVLLEYPNAPARLGDAISVEGNPATEAKLIVSGHGSKNFYVWTITAGAITNTTPVVLTYDHVTNVNFGRITKVPGDENLYIASGPVFGSMLLDGSFGLLDTIPLSFFPSWPMHARIFEYNDQRFLGYVHIKSNPAENAFYVLDINDAATTQEAYASLKQASFAARLVHNVSLGNVSNGNASAGLDIVTDSGGNVWAMAFSAGNGFIVQRFGDAVVSNTPELTPAAFTLYPNPAGSQITIDAPSDILRVMVYDMTGKLLDVRAGAGQQLLLDVAAYRNGSYIVMVQTAVGVSSRKLIVQK